MKYIPVITTALFLLLIYFSGCMAQESETSKLSDLPELQDCNEITHHQNRENCYKDVAVREKDAVICEEIQGFENIKNLCIQQIAIELRKPELCSKITGDDWRYNICMNKIRQ